MKDLKSDYSHEIRVAQLHRWIKRAEVSKDDKRREEILLKMRLLGIHFNKNHPEYKKANP